MSEWYTLDGHTPMPCGDLLTWGRWMQTANRHVAKTILDGDVKVSTVFLGLDHSFTGGTPILFETMIFGGPEDGYQERYATWAEAEAGHAKAVELASHAPARPGEDR